MNEIAYISGEWVEGILDLEKDYDIVYSVCYYLDRNKTANIRRHLQQIQTLIEADLNVLPIIVCCTDNLEDENAHKHIEKLKSSLGSISFDFQLSFMFNWGGTIAALWHVWKEYIEKLPIEEIAMVHFEEDFFAVNRNWIYDANKKLVTGIVYVGDFITTSKTPNKAEYKKTTQRGGARIKVNPEEVWTDGGYYFSSKKRLCQMEEAIGVFHKGDQTTKYNHQLDGIDYGEVGFPTLLWHQGLRFTSLFRGDYFET